MKIINVRLGLATNSSSSHSIIFLPAEKSKNLTCGYDGSGYGWDYFNLQYDVHKKDYLAVSLYTQLAPEVGEDIAASIAQSWAGYRPGTMPGEGYVDHQSQLCFPRNWDSKGLNKFFFDEFKNFILRDDIVIGGGNDNDSEEPMAITVGGTPILTAYPTESFDPWVARKDHNYWTLFNRNNGTKVRLTFEGTDFTVVPRRSSAPELVDIKITDFCPFNCAFCYQDSTLKGQHADLEWLNFLAYQLAKLEVFEVALGGGEPTLHPDFVEILKAFKRQGIVANFTTKNLGWLRDETLRNKILEQTGAFAYSAQTAAEVQELVALLPLLSWEQKQRVTVQHVLGAVDLDEFKAVLKACDDAYLRITLLGYKTVGRGSAFKPKLSVGWLEALKEVEGLKVGIDTVLVDTFWDELITCVNPRLMTRYEGQFSCYIDAVAKTINTSSYAEHKALNLGASKYDMDIAKTYALLPHEVPSDVRR